MWFKYVVHICLELSFKICQQFLGWRKKNDHEFSLPPSDNYYVVDSGYLNKTSFSFSIHIFMKYGISVKMLLLLFITSKKILNVGMHLCVQLWKWHLDFGKKMEDYLCFSKLQMHYGAIKIFYIEYRMYYEIII